MPAATKKATATKSTPAIAAAAKKSAAPKIARATSASARVARKATPLAPKPAPNHVATSLEELTLDQIKAHPKNVRREVADIDELAASIKESGVLEPLIVAPMGSGRFKTYVLIAGHRRLAAAKVAKVKTVPCIVRGDLTEEKKQLEHMLMENLHRADLSPIEEAEAYKQLLLFPGYTVAKLATGTGRSLATIKARIKLVDKLPKSARDQVHSGQLALTDANLIADMSGLDAGKFKRLAGVLERGGDVKWEIRQIRNEQAYARKADKMKSDVAAKGVRLLTKSPNEWDGTVKPLRGEQDIEAHRACPGFCAYIQSYTYSDPHVRYFCDQPDLHPEDKTSTPGTAGHQESEDDKNVKAALADAAVARRQYLADLFKRADEHIALAALRGYAREYVADSVDGWILRQVLGIDPDHTPLIDAIDDAGNAVEVPTDEERIEARLDELTLFQLALLCDLSGSTYEDNSLANTWAWRETRGTTAAYRDRIAGPYGYEWSEVEAELLDKAALERAATLSEANTE